MRDSMGDTNVKSCAIGKDSSEIHPRATPPHQPFSHPLPGRLAVLTCFFNPCGYRSLRRNYERFASDMEMQGVPLYTAELAFGEDPFVLGDRLNVQRYRARDVLWHKERLLNLLLRHVPVEFDKVAWIDADLHFTNPHWIVDAGRHLKEYPVVQLFERVMHLDAQERPDHDRMSVAWAAAKRHRYVTDFSRYSPGYAWAARRTLLERHGLLDNDIVGSGDGLMACAMFGEWKHPLIVRHRQPMQDSFVEWARPFWQDVQGHVGCVPGEIWHYWHGSHANRCYQERVEWLNRAGFDPRRDLRVGSDGLWEWSNGDIGLQQRVRQYFFDRRDDEG